MVKMSLMLTVKVSVMMTVKVAAGLMAVATVSWRSVNVTVMLTELFSFNSAWKLSACNMPGVSVESHRCPWRSPSQWNPLGVRDVVPVSGILSVSVAWSQSVESSRCPWRGPSQWNPLGVRGAVPVSISVSVTDTPAENCKTYCAQVCSVSFHLSQCSMQRVH